jgi:hypothetical protein
MENSNTVEDFVREQSTSDWRFGDYPPPIARHGPHRQLGRMCIEIGSEYLGDGPVVHQRAYRAWDPLAPGLPGLDSDFELLSKGKLHPPCTMYINMGSSDEVLYLGNQDNDHNLVTLKPFVITVVKAHVPRGGYRWKTPRGQRMKRNPIWIVELPARHLSDLPCCRSYCEEDITAYCPDVMVPVIPADARERRAHACFRGVTCVLQVGGPLSLAFSGSIIRRAFAFNVVNKFGFATHVRELERGDLEDDDSGAAEEKTVGNGNPADETHNQSSEDKETEDGARDLGSLTEESGESTSTGIIEVVNDPRIENVAKKKVIVPEMVVVEKS